MAIFSFAYFDISSKMKTMLRALPTESKQSHVCDMMKLRPFATVAPWGALSVDVHHYTEVNLCLLSVINLASEQQTEKMWFV